MADFLQFLLELVRSLGLTEARRELISLTISLIGLLVSMGALGFVAGLVSFKRRTFFDQMVIGVNILEPSTSGEHTLKLRTLIEDNLDAILDNAVLQRMVVKAAKACTEEWMVLELKNKSDHALLLTKVQNAISHFFAREYLLRLLGQPTESHWVDFVVTCERYGGLKATKIRVLVFVKQDADRLLDPAFFDAVGVEEPHHRDRLRTLRFIAKNHLSGEDVVHGRVEIPVALGHCAARTA